MNGLAIFLTARTKNGEILERETLKKNKKLEFRNLIVGKSLKMIYEDGSATITSSINDYKIKDNIITINTLNSVYQIEILNMY